VPDRTSGLTPGWRFLRDLALVLGLPAAGLALLIWQWHPWFRSPYQLAAAEQVFTTAAGTWDWLSDSIPCGPMRHTIEFSPDHRLMIIRYATPWTDSTGAKHESAEYEIRRVTRSGIRGYIRGETRRTTGGQPVVWDLVLTSPDSYTWHRTDWMSWAQTGGIHRCPAGDSAAAASGGDSVVIRQ